MKHFLKSTNMTTPDLVSWYLFKLRSWAPHIFLRVTFMYEWCMIFVHWTSTTLAVWSASALEADCHPIPLLFLFPGKPAVDNLLLSSTAACGLTSNKSTPVKTCCSCSVSSSLCLRGVVGELWGCTWVVVCFTNVHPFHLVQCPHARQVVNDCAVFGQVCAECIRCALQCLCSVVETQLGVFITFSLGSFVWFCIVSWTVYTLLLKLGNVSFDEW